MHPEKRIMLNLYYIMDVCKIYIKHSPDYERFLVPSPILSLLDSVGIVLTSHYIDNIEDAQYLLDNLDGHIEDFIDFLML